MRVLLSSVLLALAWFAVVNILMSAVTWVLARRAIRRGDADGSVLFAIRMFPACASLFFVGAVFLPSHVRFEQADTEESFGVVLAACAIVAAVMLLRSASRAAQVAQADHEFAMLTARVRRQLDRDVFTIRGVTGVSLAGILRSRILVGSETLEALTAAELDLAISHEAAHERSRDNLKRFLMYCAPDVFGWSRTARRLEATWQSASEYRADDYAVMGDERRAIVLAAALVKVAQLSRRVHGIAHPVPAWNAFHVPSLLEKRVRRLVAGPMVIPHDRAAPWREAFLVGLALSVSTWLFGLSYALHAVTEAMVTHLP
jgi:beta-lactamase regulating signal transducer with metallopeptidase domain